MRAWQRLGGWPAVALVGLVTAGALLYPRFHQAEPADEPFVPERYMWPREAVTAVLVRPAAEVQGRLAPDDLVLGVTLAGKSRAYPLGMLNSVVPRKLLNDTLAGRPVLVTWCDSCHNGLAFLREVRGQALTFRVFGSLWKKSMTMHDLETSSVWSHFDGQARNGLLKGVSLEVVPSVVTDWRAWNRQHPDGTVAWFEDGRDPEMTRALYDDPGRFVLGIASGRQARSWPLADLRKLGVVNDTWQGRPVVAMAAPDGVGARLYSRELAERTLTFQSRGGVPTDRETGSPWDALTGQATGGELRGQALTPLPAMISFRDAWQRFYPRSQ